MRATLERNLMAGRQSGAVALVLGTFVISLLIISSSANAAGVRLFKETFGSAAQPTFTRSLGVAVD